MTFRSHVEDILFKTYSLHQRHFGAEGASSVFDLILNLLREGQQDYLKAEVAYFGARSLLDALEDVVPDQVTMNYFNSLTEYFLTTQAARDTFIIAKSVILFIDQAAKMFQHNS